MKKVLLEFDGRSFVPKFTATGADVFCPGDIRRLHRALDVGYRVWRKDKIQKSFVQAKLKNGVNNGRAAK